MITWAGFIGKLVEFLATKLLGKHLDLALDQKKRACRAFLNLYDAIAEIETVLEEFITILKPIVNGEAYKIDSSLHRMSRIIDSATEKFLQGVEDLGPAVRIYDPDLSRLVIRLTNDKWGLLELATSVFSKEHMKFEIIYNDQSTAGEEPMLNSIEYTTVDGRIMALNLDVEYEAIKQRIAKGEFNWRDDVLLSLVGEHIINNQVRPDDIPRMKYLSQELSKHLDILKQAREKLREFIKNQFSLDDLLYVIK